MAERDVRRPPARQRPYQWTPDLLWNAYAALDVEHVHRADRHTVTDLISLIRFTLQQDAELVPWLVIGNPDSTPASGCGASVMSPASTTDAFLRVHGNILNCR